MNINTNDRRNFKGKCINCKNIICFKLNDSEENGILEDDCISFTINGVEYKVDNSFAFTTSLNEYLREELKMTGTKVVCKEGIITLNKTNLLLNPQLFKILILK